MMNEWTQEPWEVSDGPNSMVYGNGCLVATAFDGDDSIGIDNNKSNSNARRIVACVNACAGIPTEFLGDDDWQTLMATRKERDALRASLRDMVEYAEDYQMQQEAALGDYEQEFLETLESDIAKAKELLKEKQ